MRILPVISFVALLALCFPSSGSAAQLLSRSGGPDADVRMPPPVIDWSSGDLQDTDASCGEFQFTNMQDRHSYSLYVRGKESGTCSFLADGLTFRLPTNHGPTLSETTTLYNFQRFGADVLVTWSSGY